MTDRIERSFDFQTAFSYFKKDKDLVKKIAIVYLLLIASAVLSFTFIVPFLISFILAGYFIQNVHERIIKREDKTADFSKIGQLIKNGFFYTAACFIVFIPVMIINGIMMGMIMGAHQTGNIGIYMFLMFLIGFISGIYLFIAQIAFSVDLRFKSFFNKRAIKLLVQRDTGFFIRYILTLIGLGIGFGVACILLSITVVGILAVPALYTIFLFVLSELQAQYVRLILKK